MLDIESLAVKLIERLNRISKSYLEDRYNIAVENKTGYELLLEIGLKRGCIIRGGSGYGKG